MKILLGVCGSISAYKIPDLARNLCKKGHEVKVILTKGALEFVNPKVFNYLGVQETFLPDADFNSKQGVLHIELAKWADRVLIAPLSANTLSKIAHGMADDLLTCTLLAIEEKPLMCFPAMNPRMLIHPFVMNNLKKIRTLPNCFVHPPAQGIMACNDSGEGKLPEIELIANIATSFVPAINMKQKHVLITTGATISPLDPIRFLTNGSSGITGFHLAQYYLERGCKVTVVAGKKAYKELDHLKELPAYKLIRVITTQDMLKAVLEHFPICDTYISSAAIADIEFDIQENKIKKDTLPTALPIKTTPDVLSHVLGQKRPHQKIVAFAAETTLTDEILAKKWARKQVDLLVANEVSHGMTQAQQSEKGLGTEDGEYMFMTSPAERTEPRHLSKRELAQYIFEWDSKK